MDKEIYKEGIKEETGVKLAEYLKRVPTVKEIANAKGDVGLLMSIVLDRLADLETRISNLEKK